MYVCMYVCIDLTTQIIGSKRVTGYRCYLIQRAHSASVHGYNELDSVIIHPN